MSKQVLTLGRMRRRSNRTRAERTDMLHVPGNSIGKLKKGTPKRVMIDKKTGKPKLDRDGNQILIQGKDLNTHFRFAPSSKESVFTDYENGDDGLSLVDIFTRIYGDKPNHIPVRVLGFDHIANHHHYDFSTLHGKELARRQLQRWGVAYVRNSSGSLLVETDITCQWVIKERGSDGYLEHFDPEEREVVVHLNEQGCQGYNPKLDEGAKCYMHKGKLMPWSFIGRLNMILPKFYERAGVMGNIIFETTSVIDVEQIVDDLMGILEMVGGRVPLSNIPMILYRQSTDIAIPGFGKGHLDERRNNRVKKENWGARIRMDNVFVSKALQLQAKIAEDRVEALLAAPRQESLAEIEASLFPPDNTTMTPLPALPQPEPGETHFTSLDEYNDDEDWEEVTDGDFDELDDESIAPAWRSAIEGSADAKRFSDYCMDVFGIDKSECRTRLDFLGITEPKVRTGRNRKMHFVRMGVYDDLSAHITDPQELLENVNDESDKIMKEMA